MRKLTLNADESIIEKAKMLAEEEGTSVSAMFDRFVRMLLARRRAHQSLGPIARKAAGVISLPRGKQAGQILEEALAEKYKIDP
jgi:hypothetical protein